MVQDCPDRRERCNETRNTRVARAARLRCGIESPCDSVDAAAATLGRNRAVVGREPPISARAQWRGYQPIRRPCSCAGASLRDRTPARGTRNLVALRGHVTACCAIRRAAPRNSLRDGLGSHPRIQSSSVARRSARRDGSSVGVGVVAARARARGGEETPAAQAARLRVGERLRRAARSVRTPVFHHVTRIPFVTFARVGGQNVDDVLRYHAE